MRDRRASPYPQHTKHNHARVYLAPLKYTWIFSPLCHHSYKSPASSVVDRVLLTANETDQFLVKVMVRQCRRPEVGDKHDTGSCAKLETFTWYCYRLSILGLQVGMARKASAVQSCHRSNMIHPGWIGDVSFYEISNKFTCAITLGGYAIF